ncbi:RNA polymerase sigma factor [Novosphingobium sp. Leaf2]|uniref:RNA polymerase sigma factor n=1 Tax=Novosphingobium sp. Leaf2 TaxID=1735670 RepID=UPI0006FA6EAA|nr:sigma-70 family RNA polymerase sigma factor [Novosphingobium sp. Leaf2]KQM13351.1 RNA polymerase subunit sigma-24 [Novosphingobium sp. Leaf2]
MTSDGQEVPADAGLRQLCLSMRIELRRFLLARRIGEADAEDLLQDLYLRVQASVTGPVRAPRAYLYQMLNNMAHTRRRTELRQQSRDAHWLDAPAGAAGPDTEMADLAPDPETSLLARDHLARVEARLEELPERTAHVFRQYRVEGVSQKAIANELGISLSAVEKHLQRAYSAVLEIRSRLDPGATGRTGGTDDRAR